MSILNRILRRTPVPPGFGQDGVYPERTAPYVKITLCLNYSIDNILPLDFYLRFFSTGSVRSFGLDSLGLLKKKVCLAFQVLPNAIPKSSNHRSLASRRRP